MRSKEGVRLTAFLPHLPTSSLPLPLPVPQLLLASLGRGGAVPQRFLRGRRRFRPVERVAGVRGEQ